MGIDIYIYICIWCIDVRVCVCVYLCIYTCKCVKSYPCLASILLYQEISGAIKMINQRLGIVLPCFTHVYSFPDTHGGCFAVCFPLVQTQIPSQISFSKITSKHTFKNGSESYIWTRFQYPKTIQVSDLTQDLCLSAYHPARMSYAEYGHLHASAYCAFRRLWYRWEHQVVGGGKPGVQTISNGVPSGELT